jgi:hypothetical protein
MEQQITIRVCDRCTCKKPKRAAIRCIVCQRDVCQEHRAYNDFFDGLCGECSSAIEELKPAQKAKIQKQIAEILAPIIVVQKL